MTRVIIGHLLLLFLIHNVNSFTHPLVGVRRHKNIAFSLLAKGSPDNSGSETEASIRSISKEAESLMARSVQSVKGSLQTVRTGRASPSILDRVVVSYYGAPTPLSQLATISVPSAQQLQVAPFDQSQMGEVEKAILEANIGLVPNNDGNVIRLNIPALTEDRRKELMKQCSKLGEEGKTGVRNVRRDKVAAIKKLEKDKSIGKDEALDGTDLIDAATKKSIKQIDDIVKAKEEEVSKV